MIDIFTPIDNNISDDILQGYLLNLKESGVKSVLPTKRISSSLFEDNFFCSYAKFIEQLKTTCELDVHYGPLIRFTRAVEFAQFKNKISIDNTNYVNIELSYSPQWGRTYLDELKRFIKITGLTPIITQVELYPAVSKKFKVLGELAQMGCIFSVSMASFLDKRKKRILNKLAKHNYIDVLATGYLFSQESHCNFLQARQATDEFLGEQKVVQILENSNKVLNNKKIERA